MQPSLPFDAQIENRAAGADAANAARGRLSVHPPGNVSVHPPSGIGPPHAKPGTQSAHPAPGTHSAHPAPSTQHPAPLPTFVHHPAARRYIIRVRDDGTVRITIPKRGSKREAQAFAAAQQAWIEKQLQKVAQERAALRPPLPPDAVRELRARAARELPARVMELAARHGLAVSRVSVRNQRRRWGSCSRSGHICLNWRLVTTPDWVRDYVMIHELMHLRRMDHSAKFWRLVAAACPGYQDARAWLRKHEL